MEYYVSKQGCDAWSGTLPQRNAAGTDGPFFSLKRAREAVRTHGAAGTTVNIREGVYYFDETFTLTAQDGATREAPGAYKAYNGEKVVFGGGCVLRDWRPYKDGILVADCAYVKGSKKRVRAMFCNGEPQQIARWPKADRENPLYGGFLWPEGPAEPDSHDAIRYKAGSFPHDYAKPSQAEVDIFQWQGCINVLLPVASLDTQTRTIRFALTGYDVRKTPPWNWSCAFTKKDRFYIQNALEDLTEPGEWCVDYDEGLVYYRPERPLTDTDEVVLPVLDCVMALEGAQWITIAGITFTHTTGGSATQRFDMEGYGAMLPMHGWEYCGEALRMDDADHCLIERNLFEYIGGNAVYMMYDCVKNTFRRNEIAYAGANGVSLIGTKAKHPQDNIISDNHIHHTGRWNRYTAGVFAGVSESNIIEHNAIHDLPHHAINLANNGIGRNFIEYNRIDRTCLELHDNGAINMWMDELDETGAYVKRDVVRCGHVIRNNYITNTLGCDPQPDGTFSVGKATWGVYLDDFSSNCVVENNVITSSGVGVNVHAGRNNLVVNNIIVDADRGFLPQNMALYRSSNMPTMQGFYSGNVYRHNIMYFSKEAEKAVLYWIHDFDDTRFACIDDNLFYNTAGVYEYKECHSMDADTWDALPRLPLAQWLAMGNDAHSIIADPKMADPENGDFTLAADSPAFEIGFTQIDISRVGIRAERA